MIKFGANILSGTVQRGLSRATSDVSAATERLSSGLRINKASDDAAGLAISASLTNGARIFTQGVRNLNDGLSSVNVAEGAISELDGILVRIQELATQSSSESYSDTQRDALQKEATALTAEWNRIVESTSFNGRTLLTGGDTRTVLQGGGSANTLAVQVGKAAIAGGFDNSAGATVRASVSTAGVQADDHVGNPTLSFDGRYSSFDSYANTLVIGDTNFNSDIFKRDQLTGTTTLVSVSSAGVLGDGQSYYGSISGDGRYVTFHSSSTNLVTGDSNAANDIFVRDTLAGITTRVSTSASGAQSNGASTQPKISQDGRFVVFQSTASNLVAGDTNGAVSDIFRKDLVTGEITMVSRSTGGTVSNGASIEASVSADGRYVSFESAATNLVTGDTNSYVDVFVKDLVTGTLTRASTGSSGAQTMGGASQHPTLSADGNFVTFYSFAEDFVPGYNNSAMDIFVKDLRSGAIEQVSLTSAGGASNGNSFRPVLSADGRFVLFYSEASNLVPGDTNTSNDVFLKDRLTGSLTRVSVTTSGAQASGGTLYGGSLSADGRIVAFESRQTNLVSGDTNGWSDVFIRDVTKAGISPLAGMVVNNKGSAKFTLTLAQNYQTELANYRSMLGATTSRLGSFINTLQTSAINYTAASSRITDADVSEESARMVASTIRQQAATALLAQANQDPQIGLRLLQAA